MKHNHKITVKVLPFQFPLSIQLVKFKCLQHIIFQFRGIKLQSQIDQIEWNSESSTGVTVVMVVGVTDAADIYLTLIK